MLAAQQEASIRRRISPIKSLMYWLGKSRRGVKEMTQFSLEEIMRGTRYHEAGHAVAAYHHGFPITSVSVTDAECITNYRTKYPNSEFRGWADLWREACVTMVGPLADQRAMWGEMRPEPWAEFLAFLGDAEMVLEAEVYDDDLPPDDHSTLLQLLQQM